MIVDEGASRVAGRAAAGGMSAAWEIGGEDGTMTLFPWGALSSAGDEDDKDQVRFRLPFVEGSIRLSGGEVAILEMRLAEGRGPDLHVHRTEQEIFYVLEGRYEFQCADDVITCGPGDVVKVSPGVAHRLTARSADCHHLTLFVPAGPEGWFIEAERVMRDGPPDELLRLYERYGMTLPGA